MQTIKLKLLKNSIVDADRKGLVTVMANAFGNIDADNDISAETSFNKTMKESFKRLKWYVNHGKDSYYGLMLVGVPIAYDLSKGLQVTGQINMKKEKSREILSDYLLYAEHGKTLEHSIGVDIISRDKRDSRIVTEYRLYEYSTLTVRGANPLTPLIDIKSEGDVIETIANSVDYATMLANSEYHTEEYKHKVYNMLGELSKLATLYGQQAAIAPETTIQVVSPADLAIELAANGTREMLELQEELTYQKMKLKLLTI